MRILQVGPFPPPNGGVQTNLKAIHDLLIERGDEARVVEVPRSKLNVNTVNVIKPRSAIHLIQLFWSLGYDVIHFHFGGRLSLRVTCLMLVCGLLPWCRSVVTFHSGGHAAENLDGAHRFSLRGLAFRTIDHLIAVNSQIIEMLRSYGVPESKISLIPPYVLERPDTSVEIPSNIQAFIESHTPYLLTVGLLEHEYSLKLQIDTLGIVRRKQPNAGLMILGWGSLEDELRSYIAGKSYAEHIYLAGDIDRSITLHLIERANILLRPTLFDGDAVSIREALFLGTPVVATDNGMRPEGVNMIPMPPTVDELAAKIIETDNNQGPRRPLTGGDGKANIRAVIEVYAALVCK